MRAPASNGGPTSLSSPTGLAVDAAGDVFIAESNKIRKLSPGGELTSVVTGLSASAIALDANGKLYVAAGAQVFQLTGGQLAAFAGSPNSFSDSGDGGPAIDATFDGISGLSVNSAGDVIVADGTIRSISPDGIVQTIVGPACCSVPGAYGSSVGAVAVDSSDNIYLGFILGDVVRKISPQDVIADVAGTTNPTYIDDNGPAIDGQLFVPEAVTVDYFGNIYIADFGNSRIRKISSGVITTVAGNGTVGFSGDGGPATSAQIAEPDGLAVDSAGNLYIAEYLNNRVRKVTPDGTITTVAGSSNCCDYGDGGLATNAFVPLPHGIALDSHGNLYIAEWPGSRIRKVTPSGIIFTYAGTGTRGFSGDGGPAIEAELNLPWGLAADGYGNLYLADNQNPRVRKIASDGIITTVAGGPSSLLGEDTPTGVAVDFKGNVFTSDGWMISASGKQSWFSARTANGQVFVGGIGIAVDGRDDLFVVSGTDVLELEPFRVHREVK
jgi:hypothetical protein